MTTNDSLPGKEVGLPKEIERKWLIDAVPTELDLNTYPSNRIRQGYLMTGPDGAVRVRQKGEKFFLTFKQPPTDHVASRTELETELTEKQFTKMWPGTEGKRVEKTRYQIPRGSHMIELDVFEGDNAGNILAEVEFVSTLAADQFEGPEWFTRDVTADPRFGNSQIAVAGFPQDY